MKYLKILSLLICLPGITFSQTKPTVPAKPKLVVGIIIDQMRYDYLYRYQDKYSEGGFKRLLGQGFLFRDTHYNYIPTYTGPGHSAVYSGTTPSYNGIIANDWYDRELGRSVYVTEDTTVQGVGGTGKGGQMSPRHLLSTTVTDELRLATNRRSKVIGIALKDRGAILPAGHLPTAAYWFDNNSGDWITSTYYTKVLPEWVKSFNQQKMSDQYLSKPWETLLPLDTYQGGLTNGSAYRKPYKGETSNKFPHDLPGLKAANGYELLRETPFGNTYTLDFAIQAMQAEKLGKGTNTDFLAVSFSSTDYVGHQFGIESIEVQDTYARLDREIARLLTYLDQHYGKDNVLVFLTADHGAVETPGHMAELKAPGGIFNNKGLKEKLNDALSEQFGKGKWLLDYQNLQFWLNDDLISAQKKSKAEIADAVCQHLRKMAGVYRVLPVANLSKNTNEQLNDQLFNGINPVRSGDVVMQLLPGWFEGSIPAAGGTTHGTGYDYDTHVPLIWYGWKVKHGSTGNLVHITDIAVTVSDLLNISHPSAATGQVLSDYLLTR
ncbi:type I phosphodiesterase/nucleotide pyrophosphatase [Arcticibacter tournemirensis]|nr:alkaline phosphatase PafA [Arcticibacter tournemirensis]TQM48706.1 type I phosphodiesterase/nucleotide pyrophosphatase [Arcticibacter tournemirensis]